jgi:hypothetical protein
MTGARDVHAKSCHTLSREQRWTLPFDNTHPDEAQESKDDGFKTHSVLGSPRIGWSKLKPFVLIDKFHETSHRSQLLSMFRGPWHPCDTSQASYVESDPTIEIDTDSTDEMFAQKHNSHMMDLRILSMRRRGSIVALGHK